MRSESLDILSNDQDNYNYSVSTEENYSSDEATFVGEYASIRKNLDYFYHGHYKENRQLLHDNIIKKFESAMIIDGPYICETPVQNWLVFTAGCMGAGKGHTLQWLNSRNLFPLKSFIIVDPDKMREQLPEFSEYVRRNPETAGYRTQKEVGYISEVLTLHGLGAGKNVLVDGSLRDAAWYSQYIQNLRSLFPKIRIGIIHVTAPVDQILTRAAKRALVTGRVVPEEVILDALDKIPDSINALSPFVDVLTSFENRDNSEPQLARFWKKRVRVRIQAVSKVSSNASLSGASATAVVAGANGQRNAAAEAVTVVSLSPRSRSDSVTDLLTSPSLATVYRRRRGFSSSSSSREGRRCRRRARTTLGPTSVSPVARSQSLSPPRGSRVPVSAFPSSGAKGDISHSGTADAYSCVDDIAQPRSRAATDDNIDPDDAFFFLDEQESSVESHSSDACTSGIGVGGGVTSVTDKLIGRNSHSSSVVSVSDPVDTGAGVARRGAEGSLNSASSDTELSVGRGGLNKALSNIALAEVNRFLRSMSKVDLSSAGLVLPPQQQQRQQINAVTPLAQSLQHRNGEQGSGEGGSSGSSPSLNLEEAGLEYYPEGMAEGGIGDDEYLESEFYDEFLSISDDNWMADFEEIYRMKGAI